MSAATVLSSIANQHLIAVVRQPTTSAAIDVGYALMAAGIKIIEVACTTPDAPRVIEELSDGADDDVLLGAGTVLELAQLHAVVAAGARFTFSPHVDVALIRSATKAGVLAVPGVMTPTEVSTALAAGAPVVKLFPATTLGPTYLRALRGPFPALRAIPTGGITPENAAAWLAAGADAVAVSGAFEHAWRRGGAPAVAELATDLAAALDQHHSLSVNASRQSYENGEDASGMERTHQE